MLPQPVRPNWKIRSCGPILLSIWCVLCIPAAIKTNWILIRQVVISHQRLVVFRSDEKEAAFQSSVTYWHKKWQVVNCEAELGHWWSPLLWIKVPSVHVIVKLQWLCLVAVSWKLLRSCLMCKWLVAFMINGLGESLLQPLIWSKLQHARFPNESVVLKLFILLFEIWGFEFLNKIFYENSNANWVHIELALQSPLMCVFMFCPFIWDCTWRAAAISRKLLEWFVCVFVALHMEYLFTLHCSCVRKLSLWSIWLVKSYFLYVGSKACMRVCVSMCVCVFVCWSHLFSTLSLSPSPQASLLLATIYLRRHLMPQLIITKSTNLHSRARPLSFSPFHISILWLPLLLSLL